MRSRIGNAFFIFALATFCTHSSGHAQAGNQVWANRYSTDTKSSDDRSARLVTDQAGNVLVAGLTDEGNTGQDLLVIKYSTLGTPLWTNRYNGVANANDYASAMAVDGNDNVFVAGCSMAVNGYFDFVTIAYSSAGVPIWTNRYNGPGDLNDQASAATVDGNGNVFVSGVSWSGISYDYVTIKYSGAGAPIWTNRYNGIGNGNDGVRAMTVDGSGNVFVTGQSIGLGGSSDNDYVTIKYSNTGLPLWTNRFSGPNITDIATAITVDSSGNVIVTGYSSGVSNSGNDYLTIKYTSAGTALWTNRYNSGVNSSDEAVAVVADAAGNLFVAGRSLSGGISSYLTIAYSGNGLPLWTNRYDGPGANSVSVSGLAIDPSGNVFVTGAWPVGGSWDFATIAYSGAGLTLWTNRYSGPGDNNDSASGVAVDSSGHVIVTGTSMGITSYNDVVTIKYTSTGATVWTNRYNGSGNANDQPAAVTVDGGGNVIVAGTVFAVGSIDFATIKYSEAGVALWTNLYGGIETGADFATAVVVAGGEKIIVAGYSWNGTSYDFATIAYSSAGLPLWTNRYNGPGNADDRITSMALGNTGKVFVTGYSRSTGISGSEDYATIAYSSEGLPLWTNRYNGPGNGFDQPNAIVVRSDGNVFVAGYSLGSGTYHDFVILAYSEGGVPLWTNRYADAGFSWDAATALVVDAHGDVVVTGYASNAGTPDYLTIKYSGAGVPLWTNRYNGPGNGADQATAIASDGAGNVYVTGQSVGSGILYDFATIKYSASGLPQWTNRYNGPGGGDDKACAVAVDHAGKIFVTGSSVGIGSTNDYLTIAYSGAGMPLWTNRYNGPVGKDDQPQTKSSLAVGLDGSVYVTGASAGNYYGDAIYDYATVKYASISPLPPILSIARAGDKIIISWGNPAFALQSAAVISGTFTNIIGASSPYTNFSSGSQKFFRLISN
jgi:uncharacterized delta-60 repeat protein